MKNSNQDIPPINVIILNDNAEDKTEEMIQSCLDILETCETRYEKENLLRLVIEDTRNIVLREQITKYIQMLGEMIEESYE